MTESKSARLDGLPLEQEDAGSNPASRTYV